MPATFDPEWLEGIHSVGLTAGASAPEVLVEQVSRAPGGLGFTDQRDLDLIREDVRFTLPPELAADRAGFEQGSRSVPPKLAGGMSRNAGRLQPNSLKSGERSLAVKIVRQPKNIVLLGAPTSAAALRAGHERAPAALRAAGLVARLEAAGSRSPTTATPSRFSSGRRTSPREKCCRGPGNAE